MPFPASQWMQAPYFKSQQCTDDFVEAMGGDKYIKELENIAKNLKRVWYKQMCPSLPN